MFIKRSTLHGMIATLALLTACGNGGSEPTGSGGTTGSGGNVPGSGGSVSGSGGGTTTGSTGSGTVELPSLQVVAEFDPAKYEYPEGLAISADGKTAFVGFEHTGKVVKVSLADGQVTDFGSVPPPPQDPDKPGLVLGLALDKAGNIYVAAASFNPGYQPGIYKIPSGGGAGTLFASAAGLSVPNGLAFADSGELFVTDTLSGTVFKFSPDGKAVTTWITDPLLQGSSDDKCAVSMLPLGANGIALRGQTAFVANYNAASLVKIPIKADGTAGTPAQVATGDTNCAPLGGIDGVAVDEDGSVYGVANGMVDTLFRVGTDGVPKAIVAGGALLDNPASIAITTRDGQRWALITNYGKSTPKPALLMYGPLP